MTWGLVSWRAGSVRVSVRKDDPGYGPLAMRASVYLDGTLQRAVFTADEEKGYVHRFALDGRGLVRSHAGSAITEVRNGVVRIEVKPAS